MIKNKTPTATLTGSAILSSANEGTSGTTGTSNSSALTTKFIAGSNGTDRGTVASVVTPDNSVLIMIASATPILSNSNSTKSWTFKRGTTVLETFTLSNANQNALSDLHTFRDDTPTTGTHTYTLTENDGDGFGGIQLSVIFVEVTDTHAATSKKVNDIIMG